MTNKSLIITTVILLLGFGIWYGMQQKSKHDSIDKMEVDFSYSDVEKIWRIFFTNKHGRQIDLKKESEGKWILNDKYEAWQKKVDMLLFETFKKVKVKGAVPKPAVDNIIRDMTVTGIKVEIYAEGQEEAVQVYYVGGTTPDQTGTYFWKEGASTPYVTHVPGFMGYLNSRFDLEEKNWISRTIFAYEKDAIAKVDLTYKGHSFAIDNTVDPIKISQHNVLVNADTNALRSYLGFFRKLNMEAVIDLVENKKDSILQSTPFATIGVTDTMGNRKALNLFLKPSHDKMHNLYTKEGERLTYDPDRYYANVVGKNDLLIVQDYTFGKVLKTPGDFFSK